MESSRYQGVSDGDISSVGGSDVAAVVEATGDDVDDRVVLRPNVTCGCSVLSRRY